MNTRQRWLALALLATLVAAFWPGDEHTDDVVEAVRSGNGALTAGGSDTKGIVSTPSDPQQGQRLAKMQADLFPKQTWVPPPPKPKPYVAPPPPPPQPPPLPFRYLGRWVDGGKETLFLVQGEQPVPIQTGQELPGGWRVDEITNRTVVFTYLPLNMQSILGITP